MRLGASDELIFNACRIDPWFLAQIRTLIDTEAQVRAHGLPKTPGAFRALKAKGFSDARLARLAGISADAVAKERRALDVRPVF